VARRHLALLRLKSLRKSHRQDCLCRQNYRRKLWAAKFDLCPFLALFLCSQ